MRGMLFFGNPPHLTPTRVQLGNIFWPNTAAMLDTWRKGEHGIPRANCTTCSREVLCFCTCHMRWLNSSSFLPSSWSKRCGPGPWLGMIRGLSSLIPRSGEVRRLCYRRLCFHSWAQRGAALFPFISFFQQVRIGQVCHAGFTCILSLH